MPNVPTGQTKLTPDLPLAANRGNIRKHYWDEYGPGKKKKLQNQRLTVLIRHKNRRGIKN